MNQKKCDISNFTSSLILNIRVDFEAFHFSSLITIIWKFCSNSNFHTTKIKRNWIKAFWSVCIKFWSSLSRKYLLPIVITVPLDLPQNELSIMSKPLSRLYDKESRLFFRLVRSINLYVIIALPTYQKKTSIQGIYKIRFSYFVNSFNWNNPSFNGQFHAVKA